jgi:hypothetical protein
MKKWLNSHAQSARGVNQDLTRSACSKRLFGVFAIRTLGFLKCVLMRDLTTAFP